MIQKIRLHSLIRLSLVGEGNATDKWCLKVLIDWTCL